MNQKTRLEYIRILLRTKDDYLYSTSDPKGSFSKFGSLPGEAPGNEVPCEVCHKRGKVKRVQGGWEKWSYCPSCQGSGWRKASYKERSYDSYTREKVTSHETQNPPSMTPKQLDRALESLRNDAAARKGHFRSQTQLESGRIARDASGSYEDLTLALQHLQEGHPSLARLLRSRYDLGETRKPAKHDDVRETVALAILSLLMPKKIFIPSWEYRLLKERRKKRVLKLAQKKVPIESIAADVGMSKKSVLKVLGK